PKPPAGPRGEPVWGAAAAPAGAGAGERGRLPGLGAGDGGTGPRRVRPDHRRRWPARRAHGDEIERLAGARRRDLPPDAQPVALHPGDGSPRQPRGRNDRAADRMEALTKRTGPAESWAPLTIFLGNGYRVPATSRKLTVSRRFAAPFSFSRCS